MIKVVVSVIKKADKVLLMRRAPGLAHAGFWEFPGGKVKDCERNSLALKRELNEELNIDAEIGKLITSVSDDTYEIFVYDIKSFNGTIRLSVHDDMKWLSLYEALQYNLLPADKKIIMHMTKTKEEKTESSLNNVLCKIIEKPKFDTKTNQYFVEIKTPIIGMTRSFADHTLAMNFYIDKVRYIMQTSQSIQPTR